MRKAARILDADVRYNQYFILNTEGVHSVVCLLFVMILGTLATSASPMLVFTHYYSKSRWVVCLAVSKQLIVYFVIRGAILVHAS